VWVDNSRSDGLIRTWFDFMDAKPAQERIPIAIAAGGELNQHNRRDAWTEAVEYLWQTYARRPSYMRVNGKPVLHWYVEKDVWPEWTDARWTIRRTNHFFWSARQPVDGATPRDQGVHVILARLGPFAPGNRSRGRRPLPQAVDQGTEAAAAAHSLERLVRLV
jgi:hypothetical protein